MNEIKAQCEVEIIIRPGTVDSQSNYCGRLHFLFSLEREDREMCLVLFSGG